MNWLLQFPNPGRKPELPLWLQQAPCTTPKSLRNVSQDMVNNGLLPSHQLKQYGNRQMSHHGGAWMEGGGLELGHQPSCLEKSILEPSTACLGVDRGSSPVLRGISSTCSCACPKGGRAVGGGKVLPASTQSIPPPSCPSPRAPLPPSPPHSRAQIKVEPEQQMFVLRPPIKGPISTVTGTLHSSVNRWSVSNRRHMFL
jgi:hypothetical protein